MGLYIKNCEMPKCCYECFVPCGLLPLGWGNADEFYIERLENCPLVEIPNQHGRLIDGDKFRNRALTVYPEYWEDILEEEPTILDSE